MTTWHAELAWLGGAEPVADVLLESTGDRLSAVSPGVPCPPGATRLAGLTLPGLVNAHSHAFHRALRGRASGAGTFWTWREQMYALADRLTPDSYLALARAAYAEMALAGISCLGEFHYLHSPGMAEAVVEAARQAGVRLTLLDTCYLQGGFGAPLAGPQRLFGDGSVAAWAGRAARLRPEDGLRVGAAIHSVRAVPTEALPVVAGWAAEREAPLHVHLSEQPAENEACLAATGRTPTELLADSGALGPRTTAVHATHLTVGDIGLLGDSGTGVCLCPTTERDLADGIGPAPELTAAGCPLSLGTDSHAVVDVLQEAAAVELDERLRSGRRGTYGPAQLLAAATNAQALGWPEAGRLAAGCLADFTTVGLDGVRTAGADPLPAAVFAATAADVRELVVGGRPVVRGGRHLLVDDVAAELRTAIRALTC